ncbi:MAG TPA: histidine phosphatase family protein [Candidatus Dormibacteraeota bacterium]|nr:histidine phosphatase family protein [Candidatus Dormibacteraeota bacterium]
MGSLFLVRHATTEASRAGRNLGQRADPGLAAEGEDLAARTGAAVAAELAALGHDVVRVVTSPALRCRQTATAIAAAIGLRPLEVEPGLQELDYGAWEGLTAAECLARDPVLRARWERDPYRTAAPGGESGRDVAARAFPVLGALEAWLAADRARALVAVSHNHVLRLRLTALLGLPLREYRRRVRTDPAAYSLVTFGGALPTVRRINVTAP